MPPDLVFGAFGVPGSVEAAPCGHRILRQNTTEPDVAGIVHGTVSDIGLCTGVGDSGGPDRLLRMPLRQTQLRVPEDELEQARKLAAAKGISLAEYIRRALALQLANERAIDIQAAYDRGLEAGRREPREPGD
jgi:hypothetical protein